MVDAGKRRLRHVLRIDSHAFDRKVGRPVHTDGDVRVTPTPEPVRQVKRLGRHVVVGWFVRFLTLHLVISAVWLWRAAFDIGQLMPLAIRRVDHQ